MKKQISRRNFIKASTATGAGFLVTAGNFRKQARASALQDVAVAGIGVGGKGGSDIEHAGYYGKVVAICDVDKNTLNGQGNNFPDAKKFVDYRDVFEEMGDKFDACTINTPDHMHTIITAEAMKRGKHVYTQKPLTRTVYEARYLTELARKNPNLCTQMGNQGSVEDMLRKTAAQYKAGVIGEIKEVHILTDRPIWPQGPDRDLTIEKFSKQIREDDPDIADDEIAEKKEQIEKDLNNLEWDLWLGVAPKREYWPGIYHSFAWRGWWDFGTGSLGDMGLHNTNMIFKALQLKDPTSAVATSSGHDNNSYPARAVFEIDFPGNDWRGPVKYYWYDAKQRPDLNLLKKYGFNEIGDNDTFAIGDKGAGCNGVFHEEGGKEIPWIPEDQTDFVIAPIDEQGRGSDPRHKFEWFNAIWEGKPELCWSNFANHAGPLCESLLVGNLALWVANQPDVQGKRIEWDSANMSVKNLNELNVPGVENLIKPVYQNGYEQLS